MRISASLTSLFFCFLLLFLSCKKGEDDPAFTLLSRKARVEGNWKMIEGQLTLGFKDATGSYPADLIKFTENKYTHAVVRRGSNFEGTHSLSVQMTKKGSFTLKQQMDSVNFEFSGTWQFEGKGRDAKNKEKINFRLDKASNSSGMYHTFNKSLTNFKYKIKELRNKKMVVFCTEEMLDINSSYGVYVTAEYVFEQ